MGINKVVYYGETKIDLTEDTVTADTMLDGTTAHGADGEVVTGSMTNRGATSISIGTYNTSLVIPKGYYNGYGTVSINSSEQAKFIPSNIKSGVTILGVEGALEGGIESGVVIKYENLTVTYASTTQAYISLVRYPAYHDITLDNIIVELHHIGFSGTGLLSVNIDADFTYAYNQVNGLLTITASSACFTSSYACIATVYITEQSAKTPTSPEDIGYAALTDSNTDIASASYDGTANELTVSITPSEYVYLSKDSTASITQSLTLDSNLTPEYIRKGITIMNVLGTYEAGGSDLPVGFSSIATGTHTLSSQTNASFTVTHNLGETPDMFLFYAPSNISQTYSMLFAGRCDSFAWRGSSYPNICAYHPTTSSSTVTCANVTSSYGITSLSSTTATVYRYGSSSSYYWRAGTYKWVAIKFS